MADKTMGGLDAASTPLMDADQIAVSRGGTSTRKATIADLKALLDNTFSGDAADIPYTPTTAGDWDDAPANVEEGLDELAGTRVSGPASSTDNTVPRFDSTTGKAIQGSGVEIDDDNKMSGYKGKKTTVSADTYTFLASDTGKVVVFTYDGAIAAEVPNDLPVDWCCTVLVTADDGEITFSAEAGGLLHNRQGHTKSAGQFAMMTLYCVSNADSLSAVVVLAGDTAAAS